MPPILDPRSRLLQRPLVALGALLPILVSAPIASAGAPRLAGVLHLTQAALESTEFADEWCFPVGGPRPFAELDSTAADEPPYRVLRNVSRDSRGRLLHQGADLGNQRSGGIVKSAAAGIVVRAARDQSGYGEHVVVAHRLADGTLIYSVYAHLIRGSALVSEGDGVRAGTPLGEVGRTGRATTPHLHFELRQPTDPTTSWQLAPVLDPLAFLAAHSVATAAAPPPPGTTASP